MNRKLNAILASSAALLLSSPAYADSVIHIWTCELHDGKTRDEVMPASSDWLEVARGLEGGKDLDLYIKFRIAAKVGDNAFNFVLVADDEKTWGTWYGNPDPDGAMQSANTAWAEVASCSGSALWYSAKVE